MLTNRANSAGGSVASITNKFSPFDAQLNSAFKNSGTFPVQFGGEPGTLFCSWFFISSIISLGVSGGGVGRAIDPLVESRRYCFMSLKADDHSASVG